MTSKKDYRAIARIISINTLKPIPNITFDVVDRKGLINGLSIYFREDNMRFDKQRFLSDCEPERFEAHDEDKNIDAIIGRVYNN